MRGVPRELEEAAEIDGCNTFQTLCRVIVPMLKPSLVSCALFQFMWSSNDFQGPLIYVKTVSRYPASIFMKMSMDADAGTAWNRVLVSSIIALLPTLIVFFLAQNEFVEGISAGGVKDSCMLDGKERVCCVSNHIQGVLFRICSQQSEKRQRFYKNVGYFRNEYQIQYIIDGERYYFESGIRCVKMAAGSVAFIDKRRIPKLNIIGGRYHDRILIEIKEAEFAPICQAVGIDMERVFSQRCGVFRQENVRRFVMF